MSTKVPWLDLFPDRWGVRPSKSLFSESGERAHPSDEQLTASQDYGVIPQKEFVRLAGRRVVQINQHLDKRKRVELDDFVISMRSFQGGLERAWSSGGIRSSYVVIKPNSEVVVGYFSRLFKSREYIQALQATAHFIRDGQDLNFHNFTLIDLPLPPSEEQTQIAKFLDYETLRIDALIEKQQQLIVLLKEKRQAVISHAVTKGLNPDAPMRDSGVEWLGEVPAHWEVKQIRHITSQLGGGTPSKDNASFWDGDIPWVSPKDMKVDYIADSQDRVTEAAVTNSAAKLIPVGSVLIVVRGMILDHSVPTALTSKRVTINQDMKALGPSGSLHGEFLLFVLKGIRDYLLSHTDSSAHGTKCLATERLERTSIAVPGPDEQRDLVQGLKERLARIDSLSESANDVSRLLQERRTALISAAVTGKIDVRGWKAPESSMEEVVA